MPLNHQLALCSAFDTVTKPRVDLTLLLTTQGKQSSKSHIIMSTTLNHLRELCSAGGSATRRSLEAVQRDARGENSGSAAGLAAQAVAGMVGLSASEVSDMLGATSTAGGGGASGQNAPGASPPGATSHIAHLLRSLEKALPSADTVGRARIGTPPICCF